MCFKRKRSEHNTKESERLVAWLNSSGPSDSDFDKDTYEYQKNRQKSSSWFDDDSSMTP